MSLHNTRAPDNLAVVSGKSTIVPGIGFPCYRCDCEQFIDLLVPALHGTGGRQIIMIMITQDKIEKRHVFINDIYFSFLEQHPIRQM